MDRWHSTTGAVRDALHYRVATNNLVILARVFGARVPCPTYLPPNDFLPVAAWIDRRRREAAPCAVAGSPSSAVRVAAAARHAGLDIAGTLFFVSASVAARWVAAKALRGWSLHAIAQAQTGSPFAPVAGFDRANLRPDSGDLGQRPDFWGGSSTSLVLGDPQRYFDPTAFALPAAGFYGNLGRGTITGPGLVSLDLAAHKVLWQRERQSVRVRVEAFNVANHPNFAIPSGRAIFNSSLGRVGSAGRITATSTSSRHIQVTARWTF